MQQKVIPISDSSIYEYLQTFINKHKVASEHTAKTYEISIKQFFKYFNRDIRFLTLSDLQFTKKQIIDYQTEYLHKQLNYSYGTIKIKMTPLRSFYNYLKSDNIDVNPDIFEVIKLPKIKKPFGFISFDEALLLAELALTTEREMRYEKHTLLLLALYTSFRKSALLSITPNDIRPSEYNNGRYIISVLDKGKLVEKEINQELYDKLMYIKNKEDEPIFNMSERTIDNTIKRLTKEAGFDYRRNISLHSFKKAGVDETYDATNDIHAAQRQGNHENVQTTLNYISSRPSSTLLDIIEDRNIPEDIFNQLTREELIRLIKETTNGTKITLKRKAKEIIRQRS